MNIFLKRTLSGAIFAVAIVGAIMAGPCFFGGLLAVFLIFALLEYIRLTRIRDYAVKWIMMSASLLAYIGGILYTLFLQVELLYLTGLIPFVFLTFAVLRNSKGLLSETVWMVFGFIYIVIPLLMINMLFYHHLNFSSSDYQILLGFFAVIWVNDTFAYLTGTALGKHKFAQNISPKKTWEGFIGGLAASLLSVFLFSKHLTGMSQAEWMIFCLIIVIFGTFGDLLESALKRNFNVKDSGNLIPGHGGVLDRFDSVLLAAPFAFVYLQLIN